jgi:hypothetical protein
MQRDKRYISPVIYTVANRSNSVLVDANMLIPQSVDRENEQVVYGLKCWHFLILFALHRLNSVSLCLLISLPPHYMLSRMGYTPLWNQCSFKYLIYRGNRTMTDFMAL